MKAPNSFRATLILLIVLGVVVLAVIFIDRVSDPFTNYYGDVMRESTLVSRANNPLYCQQLSSFSFGVNFRCFDSREELDDFTG